MLRDAALVVDKELGEPGNVMTSVLPIVQSYMHHSGRISETVQEGIQAVCYRFVCDHKLSPGDPIFMTDLVSLASEETNIQAILLEATRSKLGSQMAERESSMSSTFLADTQLDALLAFSWYQHYSKPHPDVAERTVMSTGMMKKEQYLAEALFCLGNIFFKMDHYQDACNQFEEARECFKTLSNGPDLLRAGQCAVELSNILQYETGAWEFAMQAQADLEGSGSAYDAACSLLALGHFYS